MLVLVDTNVLLRVVEPRHPHHAGAVAALRSLRKAQHELCVVWGTSLYRRTRQSNARRPVAGLSHTE
jgi:predicted nucleic acid-binding protein